MAQEESSESVEIVLERARELLAAEVERSSYQSVADRVGVSKPTLYGFLNGTSTPKGDRRRKVLGYAAKLEAAGQERSDSVSRDTKAPAAGAGAHTSGLTTAGLAALWGVRSMQHHLGVMLDQILTGDVDAYIGSITTAQAEVVLNEQLLHQAMEEVQGSLPNRSASESDSAPPGSAAGPAATGRARRRRA